MAEGDATKTSNSGTVAGAGIGGSAVGTAAGTIICYYLQSPPELQPSWIIIGSAVVGALSALITHLMTRIDRDNDGIPDALQKAAAVAVASEIKEAQKL